MKEYLELVKLVKEKGQWKEQRAFLKSSGDRPKCLSVFGAQLRISLEDGFPLLTTKRIPFKQVVNELIWFLSGSTNVQYLRSKNIKIWDDWADSKGELGPIYGKQWRSWQTADGKHLDQIDILLKNIDKVRLDPNAPEARRLLVTSWNPGDLPLKAPPACHTFFQFNIMDNSLSCHLYMRSADLVLGVPWNIACYALLTSLIAFQKDLNPKDLIISFGDLHIYENLMSIVDEQLTRTPKTLSRLLINNMFTDLDLLTDDQVFLDGYDPYPSLSGEVAV